MKKLYVTPEIEIIDTELSGMLCSSDLTGSFGGDAANDPAKAPLFEDEEFDW